MNIKALLVFAHKSTITRILLVLFTTLSSLTAEFSGFTDTECEDLIRDMVTIVYKQSNIDPGRARILFITSNDLNAFVNESNNIFVFSGLILKLNTALEVFSVLCHEVGHVACGHIAAMMERMKQVSAMHMLMLPITILAGISNPGAALGMFGVANALLAHQMCLFSIMEERAADTFAIRTLSALGYPLDGFANSFRRILEEQRVIEIRNITFKSHPDTTERIKNVQKMSQIYGNKGRPSQFPPAFQERFERIFYKLSGFLRDERTFYKNTLKSRKYIRYGEVVLWHKEGHSAKALNGINELLKYYPNDPYFLELKGQVLHETGDYLGSAMCYKQALDKLGHAYLIRIELAKNILKAVQKSSKNLKTLADIMSVQRDKSGYKRPLISHVVKLLKAAEMYDDDNLDLITTMLGCYRMQKDRGMSLFMLGKISYLRGDFGRAIGELEEAIKILKDQKRNASTVENFLLQVQAYAAKSRH